MKNSPELLNLTNIKEKLTKYLDLIKSLEHPMHQDDILKFMYLLKRDRLGSGPYPSVSLFEAANRIFSDLVIFLGVKQLLNDPMVDNTRLPFTEYKVRFSVRGGYDLEAASGAVHLIGEAFNVSESLFPQKEKAAVKKLNDPRYEDADYRLIIFNSDAVKNRDYYLKKSTKPILYLPVDVPKSLHEISNLV